MSHQTFHHAHRRRGRAAAVESLEGRRMLAAGPEFDVLVFSRTAGFRHDAIDAGTTAIRQLGQANDFSVTATEDPAQFTDVNLARYEAVVFLLTTGDVLNASQQAAFERFIAAGKGYVGVHSAADTEYQWPWYGGLVGAYFQSHPAIQQATIKVADQAHPATAGLPDRWVRTDEWYNYRANPRGNVHVLATLDETTYAGGSMGFDHPIAWCQNYGGGRSFYTGVGHTSAGYAEALVRQHLLGGIRFAAGDAAGDAKAAVNGSFTKRVMTATGDFPMQFDFAPDGRVYFIQRTGELKTWPAGGGAASLVGTLSVTTEFEDGLLGLALDPDFADNRWLYLFYSPAGEGGQRLRFTVTADERLDPASEQVLLRVPTDRDDTYHSAGGLDFGPDGTLYVGVGDNTNPFASDGYAPIDERPGRQRWDAQRTAANADDLRGKILRIKPESDGSYSVPAGNLFPPDGSRGRPEIYTMGNRNPFRPSVDPETGWLYWGDVGPDANADGAARGPRGHDEFNQARGPGNFGWPYFVADNKPYVDFDFATGASGLPFDPAAPANDSPNNTGPRNLPPARGAMIWYPYGTSPEFPELGNNPYRTAIAGPVFHHDAVPDRKPYGLPAYYDDTLFVYDLSVGWVKEVKLDAAGNVLKINPFINTNLGNPVLFYPIDMKVGPDGALYALEYGRAQLVRLEYTADATAPAATGPGTFTFATAPQRVTFTFNEDLSPASLSPGDLLVENLTTGAIFMPAGVDYDAAGRAATFRFDGVLPDGNYRATLRPGHAADPAGNALAAGATANFFVLAGDANRNRAVDVGDLGILARHFNQTNGVDFTTADFNYDSRVDAADLGILATNYNRRLAGSAAVARGAPGFTPVRPPPTCAAAPPEHETANVPSPGAKRRKGVALLESDPP